MALKTITKSTVVLRCAGSASRMVAAVVVVVVVVITAAVVVAVAGVAVAGVVSVAAAIVASVMAGGDGSDTTWDTPVMAGSEGVTVHPGRDRMGRWRELRRELRKRRSTTRRCSGSVGQRRAEMSREGLMRERVRSVRK